MLHTVIDLVRQTKEIIFDIKKVADVDVKGYGNYVTQVDVAVQNFLQERLLSLYPDIQFMGEEKSNEEIDFARPVWVLDPIDGTANMMHSLGLSAVSLALVENGQPTLGVVYNPFTEDLYAAEKGKGATLNGRPIHVSDTARVHDSLIAIGTAPYHKELSEQNFKDFYRIYTSCEDIRRLGAAAIDLVSVAAGKMDAYFERVLNPWDIAAGIVILREAGGTVTDQNLGDIRLDCQVDILATNSHIHRELHDILSK